MVESCHITSQRWAASSGFFKYFDKKKVRFIQLSHFKKGIRIAFHWITLSALFNVAVLVKWANKAFEKVTKQLVCVIFISDLKQIFSFIHCRPTDKGSDANELEVLPLIFHRHQFHHVLFKMSPKTRSRFKSRWQGGSNGWNVLTSNATAQRTSDVNDEYARSNWNEVYGYPNHGNGWDSSFS